MQDAGVCASESLAGLEGAEDEIGRGQADDVALDALCGEMVGGGEDLGHDHAHPDECCGGRVGGAADVQRVARVRPRRRHEVRPHVRVSEDCRIVMGVLNHLGGVILGRRGGGVVS